MSARGAGRPRIDTHSVMTPEEWRELTGRDAPAASLASALERAGVPQRFRGVRPDAGRARSLGEGRGLYLFGDVGTGKTTRACAVLAGWASLGRGWALYASSVSLAAALMPSAPDRARSLERAATARLLVLDDLGKEPPTPWAVAGLFEVVDARWARGDLHTVATSQLSPSELALRLGERGDEATAKAVVSRLVGMCDLVRCEGGDNRIRRER